MSQTGKRLEKPAERINTQNGRHQRCHYRCRRGAPQRRAAARRTKQKTSARRGKRDVAFRRPTPLAFPQRVTRTRAVPTFKTISFSQKRSSENGTAHKYWVWKRVPLKTVFFFCEKYFATKRFLIDNS